MTLSPDNPDLNFTENLWCEQKEREVKAITKYIIVVHEVNKWLWNATVSQIKKEVVQATATMIQDTKYCLGLWKA